MISDDIRNLQKELPWLKLTIFIITVFFVGVAEFMLSSMLSPLANAFGTTVDKAALLISGYAFSYAISAPIIGYFSKKINRIKLLLISILLYGIDNSVIIFSPTLEWAIALRVFGGISSAIIIPVVFSLVSDLVASNRQAGAMGFVLVGMTSGIAFGPAMAGFLNDQIEWWAPFAFCSSGSLAIFFIATFILKREYQHFNKDDQSANNRSGMSAIPHFPLLKIIFAKGAWNGTGVATFIIAGEVLHIRYGFSPTSTGMIVSLFGIGLGTGNITVGIVNRYLVKEEITVLVMAFITLLSVYLLIMAPLPLWGYFLGLIFLGYSLGSGAPVSTVLILKKTNENNKTLSLSLAETMNNVFIFIFIPLSISLLTAGNNLTSFLILSMGALLGITIFIKNLLLPEDNT